MLPHKVVKTIQNYRKSKEKKRLERLAPLGSDQFLHLLEKVFCLQESDLVIVHSSLERLKLDFSPSKALEMLLNSVGKTGTLIFPTHTDQLAKLMLEKNEVFDQAKTFSFTGILSELARRHPDAVRSLHPFNSVCAIGPLAKELTAQHQNCLRPLGPGSPYYEAIEKGAKAIGLGVSSEFMSLVHCLEDEAPESFPIQTREKQPKIFTCKDLKGKKVSVEALLPHENIQRRFIPLFLSKHFDKSIAHDFTYASRDFFYCDTPTFFKQARSLYKQGITIYSP